MFKPSKFVLSGVTAVIALCASSSHAACTIYADSDFKGKGGVVQPNDLLRFNPEGTRDTTLVPRQVRAFREASWFEQVSSVEVTETCEAIFWNKKGSHARFHTTAQLPPEYDNPALGGVLRVQVENRVG